MSFNLVCHQVDRPDPTVFYSYITFFDAHLLSFSFVSMRKAMNVYYCLLDCCLDLLHAQYNLPTMIETNKTTNIVTKV